MRVMMKKQGEGAPTYTISADTVSVAEGNDIVLTLNTTSVKDGTQFDLIFSGTNIDTNDFTDGLLTNTVTVTNNQAILTKTIASSLADLDPETFTVQVRRIRGEVVAETTGISILGETFDVTASAYSVAEGAGVTFTVSAPNTGNGVALDLEFSGTDITASDFQDSTLINSVTVNNGTASLLKFVAQEGVIEPTETFTVQVKNPANGQILDTISTNITILDDSVPRGEATFTTLGAHSWIVPTNVTSVSVVVVGGGGGVSSVGTASTFGGSSTLYGGGGTFKRREFSTSSGTARSGGFSGGIASLAGFSYGNSGGGGAGGYTSTGGNGTHTNACGGGGGGVGLYGGGSGGSGGTSAGTGGTGGSGGQSGSGSDGGRYGGGAGACDGGVNIGGCGGALAYASSYSVTPGQTISLNVGSGGSGGSARGGQGAVRIIWGPNRSFPSTTTDQASSNGNIFNY